jgi:hypothetical protein
MDLAPGKQQEVTAISQRPVRGRPFPPGQSGNPLGRNSSAIRLKQSIAEHYSVLLADFPNPTPAEGLLLQQCARLLARIERMRVKDTDLVVRGLGTVRRFLVSLHRHRIASASSSATALPSWSPLLDRLRAEPKEPVT